MDKFLDVYNQQKLKWEVIENLNRYISSNDIEAVIKNLPTRKTPGPDGLTVKFY
jgi:hypothetical protein